MTLERDSVLEALKQITDPASGSDIVTAGVMRALSIEGGTIRFVLEINPDRAKEYEAVQALAEAAVKGLDGVETVSVVMTGHSAPKPPPDLKTKRKSESKGPERIPGVEHIIAIASGKGGVGKSTVASNLACALAAEGRRVGLLDADIYGPSIAMMLGVPEGTRPKAADEKHFAPIEAHGLKTMSMAYLVTDQTPMAWRGPMAAGALQQLLGQTMWGELDILVVDMPPGTGDIQLTLAQKAQVSGAVIVTTPQDIALLDAKKGIKMFLKVKIPVLGIVENMAVHICSECGHSEAIFGDGGGASVAEQYETKLLGSLPLDRSIRENGDAGLPSVVSDAQGQIAQYYGEIARSVIAELEAAGHDAGPEIIFQ